MGKHWEGRLNGRGLWPRGTLPEELPELFAEPVLGPRRRAWLLSYYQQEGRCLVFMGARLPRGYGQLNIGGTTRKAHRVAYAMYHGIDPGELEVCHACDNPPCGSKSHLFLGSRSDNERDKVRKNRHNPVRGSRNSRARLTEELVREMRELHGQGWGIRTIARHFDLPRTTVKCAVLGITWAHL